VDADTEFDLLCDGNRGIAPGHRLLHLDRTAQGVDYAAELDEQPVAGGLDQPAAMRSDRRVDHFAPNRPEPVEGSFFVGPDQPE
jgi:hypothetical protein